MNSAVEIKVYEENFHDNNGPHMSKHLYGTCSAICWWPVIETWPCASTRFESYSRTNSQMPCLWAMFQRLNINRVAVKFCIRFGESKYKNSTIWFVLNNSLCQQMINFEGQIDVCLEIIIGPLTRLGSRNSCSDSLTSSAKNNTKRESKIRTLKLKKEPKQ